MDSQLTAFKNRAFPSLNTEENLKKRKKMDGTITKGKKKTNRRKGIPLTQVQKRNVKRSTQKVNAKPNPNKKPKTTAKDNDNQVDKASGIKAQTDERQQ